MKWKFLKEDEELFLDSFSEVVEVDYALLANELDGWIQQTRISAIAGKLVAVGYLKWNHKGHSNPHLFITRKGKIALAALKEDKLEILNKRKRIEELIKFKITESIGQINKLKEENSKALKEMRAELEKKQLEFFKSTIAKNRLHRLFIYGSLCLLLLDLLKRLLINYSQYQFKLF